MRAWGFCRFIALLLLMLMQTTAFGVAGSENFAGVTWVLYQNRKDFFFAHQKVRNQFAAIDGNREINQTSFFSIPESHYFPVSIHAPVLKNKTDSVKDSFENKLEQAVETVEKADFPNLIINIVSHGTQSGVGREFGTTIPLDNIVNAVFDIQKNFVKRTAKQLTVWFFYSACESGFIIDKFRRILRDRRKGTYSNGDGGKYTAPYHIFTSADDDDYGWGSEFIDTRLTFQSPSPAPEELASHAVMPDWISYGTREINRARFNYWSSFNPTLTADAIHYATRGSTALQKRTALRALSHLDVPFATLSPALESLLSSSNSPATQLETMKYFRRLSSNQEGLDKVDAAVLKLFEFSPNLEVRAEAAHTLNFRHRYADQKVITRFITGHYASFTLPAKISALKALELSSDRPEKLFALVANDYVQLAQAQARTAAGSAGSGVDKRELDAFMLAARKNTPNDYSRLIPGLKSTYFKEGIEVKQSLVQLLKYAEPNAEWLDLLISEYAFYKSYPASQFKALRDELAYSLQSSMGTASDLFPIIAMDTAFTEERLRKFISGKVSERTDLIVDILQGVKDPKSDDFQSAIKAITWTRHEHGREVILRLLESGWTEDHQAVYSLLAKLYNSKPDELRRIGPGILKTLNTRFEDRVFPLGGFISFHTNEAMKADVKGNDAQRAGAALHFIAAYGGPQDFPLLIEATRSSNEIVRRSAIFALAQTSADTEELLHRLEEIAEDGKETPELRMEALRTLHQLEPARETLLVGKLITQLKVDKQNKPLLDYVRARASSILPPEVKWLVPYPTS